MKKTSILLACVLLLFLSACGGNVDDVDVLDWKPSEIYPGAQSTPSEGALCVRRG